MRGKPTEIITKLKCMFKNIPLNRFVIFIAQNSGIPTSAQP